jgi:hypothetical protein
MRRHRQYDDDSGSDIVKDGERVTVRLDMCDGMQRSVADAAARQRLIDAKLRDHNRYLSHRPHAVADALGKSDSLNHSLADAVAARDQAFADLCRRSENAWRKPFRDARSLNAMPPEPPEPAAQWEDPDNDEDDDRFDLDAAMKARDRARDAQYDRQLWRNPPNPYASNGNLSGQNSGVLDPTRASAIQAQGMRWRHGA